MFLTNRDAAKEKIKKQAMTALGGVASNPEVQEAAKKAASDPENQKMVADAAK